MAKARKITPVRDRAIAAYYKVNPDFKNRDIVVNKSRSKSLVTVMQKDGGYPITWSYKGGSLRKLGA